MKLYNAIYKSVVALTMAGSAMLVSCDQEPEPIPAEETYLRNFIKMYGLIDPEQDWNMATTTSLTLIGDGVSRDVNVLVSCGGTLRRVGEFKNVKQNITIPNLDIPTFATALYVESNGEIQMVELDGEVQMSDFTMENDNGSSPSYVNTTQIEDMAWIIAGEDLGATDDMDFNDIVFRIESVAVNYKGGLSGSDWQVVDEDGWVDITTSASRDDEADKQESKRLRITAMASGGTLPLYLHYRLSDINDYIIGYTSDGGKMVAASSLDEIGAKQIEWHRWFGYDRDDIMLNTGTPTSASTAPTGSHAALGVATIYVNLDFSIEKYSYVDYDGDNSFDVNESWKWTDFKYVESNLKGFYITVGDHRIENCSTVLYAEHKGAAPMMFLIPDAGPGGSLWHWPTERTNIMDVYPQFSDWVGDVKNYDWFLEYSGTSSPNVHYMRK